MRNKLKTILMFLFLFCSLLIIISNDWLLINFGNIEFEQYLYYLTVPIVGANTDVFYQFFRECVFPCCLAFFSFILFFKVILKKFLLTDLYTNLSMKYLAIRIINCIGLFISRHRLLFSFLALFLSSFYVSMDIGLSAYIESQTYQNTIYDEYYVNPSNVDILFPENKKNLILIYLESMETTYSSIANGGAMSSDLIPELSNLANSNISFSNTEKLGGILPITGSTWTMAGLFSTSTGIQLHSLIDYNSTDQVSSFMPNVISLGDILSNEGYKQVLMLGSDSRFGNRYSFYKTHGDYEIFDYYTAIEKSYIPSDYYEWWGYEDSKLFDFAKDKLEELSQDEQPFNLTLLTVDTHFVGGYLDSSCDSPYDDNFKNVLLCNSSMVGNFISWIQKQDFYENTTIVILGDHLTMDNAWITENVSDDYIRTVYNVFINAMSSETVETKNRIFSSFDLYPTILSSLGVEVEGNKLGLGTDLFSDSKTLPEQIGFDVLNSELFKKSKYYDDNFVYN